MITRKGLFGLVIGLSVLMSGCGLRIPPVTKNCGNVQTYTDMALFGCRVYTIIASIGDKITLAHSGDDSHMQFEVIDSKDGTGLVAHTNGQTQTIRAGDNLVSDGTILARVADVSNGEIVLFLPVEFVDSWGHYQDDVFTQDIDPSSDMTQTMVEHSLYARVGVIKKFALDECIGAILINGQYGQNRLIDVQSDHVVFEQGGRTILGQAVFMRNMDSLSKNNTEMDGVLLDIQYDKFGLTSTITVLWFQSDDTVCGRG